MKSLNSKDYLFVTFVALVLSFGLILFGLAGGAPYLFYLLSLIAIVLAVISPTMLFWLFLAMIPLDNVLVWVDWLPINLRPFQLFGFYAIVAVIGHWLWGTLKFPLLSFRKICVVCSIFSKKKCELKKEQKAFSWLDRLVFIFPVFALLGVLNAPEKALSVKLFVILVSFVALFWLVRNFMQTKKQAIEGLWFFAIGTIPVLIFGFYQAIANRLGWISFEVFDKRVNGTFTEPDWFGMYLAIIIALILWIRFALLKRKDGTMLATIPVTSALKWATMGDIFIMTVLLLLTASRSAWLGLTAVVAVYLILIFLREKGKVKIGLQRSFREGVVLALAIFLAGAFVWGTGLSTFHLLNRASSSVSGLQKITVSCEKDTTIPRRIDNVGQLEKFGCVHINLEDIEGERGKGRAVGEVFRPDPNVNVRKEIYVKSWEEIKKHPIIGQGVGSSGIALGSDEHGSAYNASNIFLETWLAMGIGGLVILLTLFFYPILWAIKNVLKGKRFGVSAFVLLTAMAVILPNLFNSGLLLGILWVWLAVVVRMVADDFDGIPS